LSAKPYTEQTGDFRRWNGQFSTGWRRRLPWKHHRSKH